MNAMTQWLHFDIMTAASQAEAKREDIYHYQCLPI